VSDLLMICPSRGRPENVARLLQAWAELTSSAELLIAVDDDDPQLEDYLALDPVPGSDLVIGPRLRLGPTLNKLAAEYADLYFALGFLGDDHCPRTQGWDERLVEALRELGTGIVYGNDLFQGERLPTAVAMTSDIVRTLGYFVPPGMEHMFLDDYWKGLGQALGRLRYLPEVVIEHLHPIADKAEWDQRYYEVNAPEMYARDRQAFARWIREESVAAIASLQHAVASV
jgi:hypothetical protein